MSYLQAAATVVDTVDMLAQCPTVFLSTYKVDPRQADPSYAVIFAVFWSYGNHVPSFWTFRGCSWPSSFTCTLTLQLVLLYWSRCCWVKTMLAGHGVNHTHQEVPHSVARCVTLKNTLCFLLLLLFDPPFHTR